MRRFLVIAFAAAACNSPPTGVIQITTGGETDTFTRAPAPTVLVVYSNDPTNPSAPATKLGQVQLPADTIDLGNLNQTQAGSLDVQGLDMGNNLLVHGTSISLEFGALAGGTLPVFVQRVGEMARMPGTVDARPSPLASTVTGRFVFVAGGTDPSLNKATQIYDFATFSPLDSPPTMSRAPLSLAVTSTLVWLIDGISTGSSDFGASTYDLSGSTSGDSTMPPMNLNYADVAGGTTVTTSDGSQIIVGGTRTTGMPTAAVLVIDSSGTQWASTLSAKRLGASAAWSDYYGLVVVGGSTTAAGVETFAPSMTASTNPIASAGAPMQYPPDPTTGAGASALDGTHVLVAGGVNPMGKDAGVRVVDLGCSKDCTTTSWGTGLPKALSVAQTFAIGQDGGIVVGNEASGTTHVFRLTSTTATELPLKIPRTNAAAVLSPLGTIVVLGGGSNVPESFTQ